MPQVTVAAINGACAGAGLGWACACDLRYVARSAKLNTAFLDVAVAGDMGLPWTLPRLVGASRARDLSFFPRRVTADEAVAIGLVDGAFDDDVFAAEVRARVERLAGAAPLARRGMKAHYVAAESMGFGEFVALETEAHGRSRRRTTARRPSRAFVEKRTPTFQGKMTMLNIRQIALVARDDVAAAEELIDVLGLAIGYHDPHIANLGLHNTLLPIGTQLLEIVAPGRRGHHGRALPRAAQRRRAATWSSPRPTTTRRVGPVSTSSASASSASSTTTTSRTCSCTRATPVGRSWRSTTRSAARTRWARGARPARDWQQAIRTDLVSAITAAEMQCDDPDKVATRWSEIVEIDRADVDGVPTIPLDNATLRFVPITDGRGEGLGGIDLACADPDTVRANASRRGVPVADDHVVLVGMRCYLR